MLNYAASPEATEAGIAWWLERIPDAVLRHLDGMGLVQEECRENLHRWVTEERNSLAALECELRTEIEEPALAQAAERALVLKGDKAANYDRYFRSQTSAFHRAEKSLKESLRKPLQPGPEPAPPAPPGDGPEGSGGVAAAAETMPEPAAARSDAVARGVAEDAETTLEQPEEVSGDVAETMPEPAVGAAEDVSRGVAEGAEKTLEEPVRAVAALESRRTDSASIVEPSAAADEDDDAVVPEEADVLDTASLLALAPPPPRATYLVETARRLIAQASGDGSPGSTPSAAPAGRIRGPHEVGIRATQATTEQEDKTTNSASENAPKEIRFDTARPTSSSGPLPLAGRPVGVPDPSGGAGAASTTSADVAGWELGGRDPTAN
jgi:hypothetical protein